MHSGSHLYFLDDDDHKDMPQAHIGESGSVWVDVGGNSKVAVFASQKDALGFEELWEWAHGLMVAIDAARLDWVESLPYNQGRQVIHSMNVQADRYIPDE